MNDDWFEEWGSRIVVEVDLRVGGFVCFDQAENLLDRCAEIYKMSACLESLISRKLRNLQKLPKALPGWMVKAPPDIVGTMEEMTDASEDVDDPRVKLSSESLRVSLAKQM